MTTNIDIHPNYADEPDIYEAEYKSLGKYTQYFRIEANGGETTYFLSAMSVRDMDVFIDSLEISIDQMREWNAKRMMEVNEDIDTGEGK